MDITTAYQTVFALQDTVALKTHRRLLRKKTYSWTDTFTGNVYLAKKTSRGLNPYVVQLRDTAGLVTDLGHVHDVEAVRGRIILHVIQNSRKPAPKQ